MKIGLIGLGYWGNIILKNLEDMDKKDLILCDAEISGMEQYQNYEKTNDFKKLDCDYIFISTPTSTHYELCKYFLERGISIFCEKPLTTSSKDASELYNLAIKNNCILFIDWIFTFNSQIDTIKQDYVNGKLGKIKSIFMNRLNLGPERFDVNAKWDLASHDVSIIQYLFSEEPKNVKWIDYKRKKESIQQDSAFGLIEYKDFSASINVSWFYRKKVRECVFEFEKYFILWDDFKRFLQYEDSSNLNFPIYSGNLSYPCGNYQPPLVNSINNFFSFKEKDMIIQKKLTIDTIKILEQ